jgi:hypothetical protein
MLELGKLLMLLVIIILTLLGSHTARISLYSLLSDCRNGLIIVVVLDCNYLLFTEFYFDRRFVLLSADKKVALDFDFRSYRSGTDPFYTKLKSILYFMERELSDVAFVLDVKCVRIGVQNFTVQILSFFRMLNEIQDRNSCHSDQPRGLVVRTSYHQPWVPASIPGSVVGIFPCGGRFP